MVTWPRNLKGKIKMRIDGTEMMVPAEDCVWTKKNGELHHIHTLGEGFSLFEFEGLTGTFVPVIDNTENTDEHLEDFPKVKKPKKLTTKDWLFDN
jgi:hypothetical protein